MVGTIGAGIMPHNLYLHSGICKQRACDRSDDELFVSEFCESAVQNIFACEAKSL